LNENAISQKSQLSNDLLFSDKKLCSYCENDIGKPLGVEGENP
jgi:hypothetical protein